MNIVKTIRQKPELTTAEAVVECIRPIRNEYDKLIADKQYLMDICQRGADSAKRISQRTLKKVYKKVGFVL